MLIIAKKTNKLDGQAVLPGSKSQTIRGLLLACLADGQSVLRNALDCSDTNTAINVFGELGAKISKNGHDLEIESFGLPLLAKTNRLRTDNSGITTRFVMPLLGLRQNCAQEIILDCAEQMRQRPTKPLLEALNNLGMRVASLNNDGACPISATNELRGGSSIIDGLTSQYLSALLFSLPCAINDSVLMVENLHERPYVEMTLAWLDEQRIKYEHKRENKKDIFTIYGRQKYIAFDKNIPADFSSASYLIAGGVLRFGQVELIGLNMNDQQGDKRLVKILRDMGADITVEGMKMTIKGGRELKGAVIDCNDIPDMVPTLAVIGAHAQGRTELVNVRQARIKETDRIKSMYEELSRMGARVEEKDDGLIIYQSDLRGAPVHGHNDHRTIMALAVAGLVAEGETIIDTAESINKTFPKFVETMNQIGADIKMINS